MNKFLLLAAVVAASAVVSECGLLLPHRRSMGPEFCEMNLVMNCILPNIRQYEATLKTEADFLALFSQRASLEQFASKIIAAADCINQQKSQSFCQGAEVDEIYDIIVVVAQYMRNADHLDILEALPSSVCANNAAKEEEVMQAAMPCILAFISNEASGTAEGVCDALNEMETCTVGALEDVCDDKAAAFFQSLWDFVKDPNVRGPLLALAEMNPEEVSPIFSLCYPQANVARRFAKRALAAMKR